MNERHHNSRLALPEAAIGVGLLVFAGIVLWQTLAIPVSPLYAKIGPTIFPLLTAGGLAIWGVLLVLQAARGGWQDAEEKAVPVDWYALAFVAAGLVVNVAVITILGFTAASTALFVLVAHGFGSRRPLRDAGIGFVLSLLAYFGFAKALGVNIGAGFVERLFGG